MNDWKDIARSYDILVAHLFSEDRTYEMLNVQKRFLIYDEEAHALASLLFHHMQVSIEPKSEHPTELPEILYLRYDDVYKCVRGAYKNFENDVTATFQLDEPDGSDLYLLLTKGR